MNKKRLYIIPPGPDKLRGKLFARGQTLGGEFRDYFESLGYELCTIDEWSFENHRDSDTLIVFNHPQDSPMKMVVYWFRSIIWGKQKFPIKQSKFRQVLRAFNIKILYQCEPPVVTPYPYKHLKDLQEIYNKVFTHADMGLAGVDRFIWPFVFGEKFEKFFDTKKTKDIVMINSNARPHGFFRFELYSERLRAIRHFVHRIDLYGNRWNKLPRFPWWLFGKYTKQVWRGRIPGEVDDKLPTQAQYRFTMCFENSMFPGYVTEKIMDCLVCGSIPIYLGAPDISDYVPNKCFIDMRQFDTYDDLEKYLNTLTVEDFRAHRDAVEKFITSSGVSLFSAGALAEKLLDTIKKLSR